jgi:lipid-A-disaccharide synthase
MKKAGLFLSVGDPSGDNAAGRLIEALNKIAPGTEIFGLGGERLKALGQRQLARGSDLAVLGFWEVARRFSFFRRLMNQCVAEIADKRPAAVVLVDYPGFNLRLAKRIKKLGIPIIYYISPQVWAWGKKRLADISELVDLMIVILPFEKDLYDRHKIKNEFVGHYLLEDIPEKYIQSGVPDTAKDVLALLPGSRPQEIQRMLAPMLASARIFNKNHGTRAVVAGLEGVYDYESTLRSFADDNISIVYNDPRRVIYDSRLVLTASGTATLEAGIIGRPMVVIYKTGFITYQIARRLVKLDTIGLVNLVLGEKVVPELIQREANPQRIAAELDKFIMQKSYCDEVTNRLGRLPDILGGKGASERTARLLGEYL